MFFGADLLKLRWRSDNTFASEKHRGILNSKLDVDRLGCQLEGARGVKQSLIAVSDFWELEAFEDAFRQ